MRYELELPDMPPPSPNDRLDRYAANSRTQAWRSAAGWAAKGGGIPRLERVEITLTLTPCDRRKRDATNLYAALKAAEDGLVDAGVIVDDSWRYVTAVSCRIAEPDTTLDEHRWVLEIVETSQVGQTT